MDWPPIKYFIVLMLENRSFDHMLGFLESPDYPIEGLDRTKPKTNDDTNEVEVPVDNTAQYSGDFDPDPGHDFDDVTMQLYGTGTPGPGAIPDMSGFVRSYAKRCNGDVAASHRIMKCFDPARLPVLTTLARQYAVCDHWFSSLPGPTLPNRLFAHAGTSGGRLDMAPEDFSGFNTIHEVLDKADVSSTIYADGWSGVATIPYLLKFQTQFFATFDDFIQGCKRGKLSSYTFIEPRYGTALDSGGVLRPQNDQHPDSDVAEGENLIRRVYGAIRGNKKIWNNCVFVVTYDEHGGLYDHVAPPATVNPDGKSSVNPSFDFTRLGLRVPAVVISPFVSPRKIVSDQFDHTTLLATAAALFLKRPLQADELGARAAQANTILNCFNEALYDNPRQDMPAFPAPASPAPLPETEANDLLKEYVQQAIFLEQKLPAGQRTGIDTSKIQTDGEAQDYLQRVYALLPQIQAGLPATGGDGE
jgi:phospholipase C